MTLTIDQRIELAERRVEKWLSEYESALSAFLDASRRYKMSIRAHQTAVNRLRKLRKARERMTG